MPPCRTRRQLTTRLTCPSKHRSTCTFVIKLSWPKRDVLGIAAKNQSQVHRASLDRKRWRQGGDQLAAPLCLLWYGHLTCHSLARSKIGFIAHATVQGLPSPG
ncbi:hypothetical protein BU16DRAFT_201684 [Lophium mytilinum]|uniref:Uncharacterized protein n=1 Tax=Lophium mytilinum TaxID=390894 RepID=A0A6A6R9P3_9PEZI|nr:hypothetical protein BU16DRAFT_201684 [Lophium mytilinum]